jgi:hypothetical protein
MQVLMEVMQVVTKDGVTDTVVLMQVVQVVMIVLVNLILGVTGEHVKDVQMDLKTVMWVKLGVMLISVKLM